MICSVNFSQCKINQAFDKFTNTNTYRQRVDLYRGSKGFALTFIKSVGSETFYTFFTISNFPECISPSKTYIKFLFSDGNVMEIKYNYKIECGTSFAYFNITENQLKELKDSKITDVRITYEYSRDYEINEKMQSKLKDAFACILNAGTDNTTTTQNTQKQ